MIQSIKILVTSCLSIYSYYALALGINTMRYDQHERRVIKSPSKAIYARCINVIFIVGMVYGYYSLIEMPAESYVRGHELLRLMELLNIAVQFSMTIWTLLLRFQREYKYMEIMEKFYELDNGYMQGLSDNDKVEQAAFRLLCIKLLAMLTRMIMTLVIPLQLAKHLTLHNCLLILYFANMQNLLPAIVFRYFYALLQAWKRFKLLNIELRRILDSGDANANVTIDLWQLVCAHWQFRRLLQLLSDTYKYQMIGTLLTYLIRSIAFSFYTTVLIAGTIQTDALTISLGVVTFCALYVDIYVLYWISEALERAYKRTREILRECDASSAHVEWLSLQLTHSNLQISMGGMFNLNMHAMLGMLAYSLQHTLIWVQFDWAYYGQHLRHTYNITLYN